MANEFDKELISAYLDDMLAEPDRGRALKLLAADAGARQYLSRLRNLRAALNESKSNVQLPLNFAQRVVAASQQATTRDQTQAHSVTARPRAASLLETRYASLALAAALLLAAIPAYFVWLNTGAQGDRVAQTVGDTSREPQGLVAEVSTEQKSNTNVAEAGLSPFGTPNADSRIATNGKQAVGTSPRDTGSAGNAVSNDSVFDGPFSSGNSRSKTLPVGGASQTPNRFRMLLVVDIAISENAWKAHFFDQLLDEAEIPLSKPIVANKALEEAFAETRVSMGRVGQAADNNSAAFVFVQAPGKNVEKVISRVYQGTSDFPEISLDLAIENRDKRLLEMLEALSPAAAGGSGAQATAIVTEDGEKLDDLASAAQFSPGPRRGGLVSSVSRQAPLPSLFGAGASELNPVSQVLFVLRHPQ